MRNLLSKELEIVKNWSWPKLSGRVTHVVGMLVESVGPESCVGQICYIFGKNGKKIPCQVVGFKEQKVLLMPFGDIASIPLGAEVFPTEEADRFPLSSALCGRVLNGLGQPIDGKGPLAIDSYYPSVSPPISPMEREPINEVLTTGIKAIDGFLTIGHGQRVGIFSQAGVGKSTLMATIARQSQADVNVIALIGERGREVREFVEQELGKEGLARSVVVASTTDVAAPVRQKGAAFATAIAEYFRAMGKNVILMIDSITRYSMAVREVGLAIGELPTASGYPPSLYTLLPTLLERAGKTKQGSITGIYSILSEPNEKLDTLSDYFKSLLDGHIFLSNSYFRANHFPPIDILQSFSRLMPRVVSKKHYKAACHIRELLAAYYAVEELIQVGAYQAGSDAKAELALKKKEQIFYFLQQSRHQSFSFDAIEKQLVAL